MLVANSRRKLDDWPPQTLGVVQSEKRKESDGIGKYVSCLAFKESRCLLIQKLLHTPPEKISHPWFK